MLNKLFKTSVTKAKPQRGLIAPRRNILVKSTEQQKSHFNQKSSFFGKASNWGLVGVGIIAAPLIYYAQQTAFAEEEEKPEQKTNAPQEEQKQEAPKKAPRISYQYVIIGGGTAAFAAVQELLERDKDAKILIISEESYYPYSRPPLSKELWKSQDPNVATNLRFTNFEGKEQIVFYEADEFYNNPNIKFLANTSVIDIDPYKRAILLKDKSVVDYQKCLIATGGTPRLIPGISDEAKDHVTTYRTLGDFKFLYELTKNSKHVIVIGGGFLGSELSCSLALRAKNTGGQVSQVFPETGLMANNFPRFLSDYATARVKTELGYQIFPERLVNSVTKNSDGKIEVVLDNGQKLVGDHVVVSAGIRPNIEIAAMAGLEIDQVNGGISVNSELEARSDLYVAGDVASYFDAYLGRRRVEHYDQAVATGRHAAKNMAGAREPFLHLPFFWSDVSTMGYEAVGNLDSRLRTVSFWEKKDDEPVSQTPDYRRGIVYYLSKDDRVVGVLLWNVFGKVDDARAVIKSGGAVTDVAKLQHAISLMEEPHQEEQPKNE